MKVQLVRRVVETDYSGEHSVVMVQTVEAELTFCTKDGIEPKPKNPRFSMVEDWKVIQAPFSSQSGRASGE